MDILNLILTGIIVLLAIICLRLKLRQRSQDTDIPHYEGLPLHISNNDVMQYIRSIADGLMPIMESKGIELHVKCEPESMMGWIDTDKIDKIGLLLLSDSLRNTPSNGKITLNAYTNSSYDQIIIRISDNCPMTDGIGFLIAYNLVRLHHGTIRNKYYEGQGNTITIELPIKKDAFQNSLTEVNESEVFHIPSNITLHVPNIDLPTGYDGNGDEKQLEAYVQQTYVSTDQEYLQRAIRCINEHLSDSDYDREAFATDMGSSVSSLYNKIRALTGKSVTNFIRDIRIKTACRLAKESPDLRVSDIAYQVGFRDPKYFATSFKRVMGIQPKEYFNQLRNQK